MSRTKMFIAFTLLIAVNVFAAKKNHFMDPSTDQFKNVTSKLIGKWNLKSYVKGNDGEQIGTNYTSGTMDIAELKKKGKAGIVTMYFEVSRSIVDERIEIWNKKNKELEVEKYYIVATGNWRLSSSGEILHMEDITLSVKITGTGKQLENFTGAENAFIESASLMKNSGGLGNMLGGKILQSASGTKGFSPKIPDQTNFEFGDQTITFKNISKLGFEFSK